MDLWIRSQDKTRFIKCIGLEIKVVEQERVLLWCSQSNGRCFIVGEFKTEERALEVLDEIQSEVNTFYGFEYANYKVINVVYEIPEE